MRRNPNILPVDEALVQQAVEGIQKAVHRGVLECKMEPFGQYTWSPKCHGVRRDEESFFLRSIPSIPQEYQDLVRRPERLLFCLSGSPIPGEVSHFVVADGFVNAPSLIWMPSGSIAVLCGENHSVDRLMSAFFPESNWVTHLDERIVRKKVYDFVQEFHQESPCAWFPTILAEKMFVYTTFHVPAIGKMDVELRVVMDNTVPPGLNRADISIKGKARFASVRLLVSANKMSLHRFESMFHEKRSRFMHTMEDSLAHELGHLMDPHFYKSQRRTLRARKPQEFTEYISQPKEVRAEAVTLARTIRPILQDYLRRHGRPAHPNQLIRMIDFAYQARGFRIGSTGYDEMDERAKRSLLGYLVTKFDKEGLVAGGEPSDPRH